MTYRINRENLDNLAGHLNKITGQKEKPYEKVNGKYVSNAGVYYISQANGGYSLEQMCKSGGSRDVLSMRTTKQDLFDNMHSFLKGFEVRDREARQQKETDRRN